MLYEGALIPSAELDCLLATDGSYPKVLISRSLPVELNVRPLLGSPDNPRNDGSGALSRRFSVFEMNSMASGKGSPP